eukprot:1178111-Prorocentrum_minimum.AAC.3
MCVNLRTSCVLGRWALLVPSDTTRQVQAGGSDSQSNHIHCTANSRRGPPERGSGGGPPVAASYAI